MQGLADQDAFKAGMRRLAASVTVLTVMRPGGRRHGMTATAICSVSAEPPTLLCCINRSTSAHEAFIDCGHFAINVLSASDGEIANRFASRLGREERFEKGCWLAGESGVPLLESAVANFECRRTKVVDVGTHSVIFGEVEAVRIRGEHVLPLLYAHGGYGRFSGSPRAALPDMLWVPSWGDDL
jgi:flavin reductase (NADH)/flavin reductase